jgi:hypothetical protein
MAKYDASKQYSWKNEDEFRITGREFSLFLHTIRAILSTEQAAQILLADKANAVIDKIMAEYVEKDIIKEVVDEPLRIIK